MKTNIRVPYVTLEQLAKLKTAVGSDSTNQPQASVRINDGACALLLASTEALKRHNCSRWRESSAWNRPGVAPRSWASTSASDPEVCLGKIRLRLDDFDRIENQ